MDRYHLGQKVSVLTKHGKLVSINKFILGSINENSLKKLLLNRLVTANIRRGSNHKLYPRFSQLVVSSFAGIMWIDNPKFSINDHVKEIPRNVQFTTDPISAKLTAKQGRCVLRTFRKLNSVP
ncbi:unnamed protein product [Didymodactylos carnosus]|uniref:Uncharacterized protein n=1 Tax=Didymodactylos carnosus TaxID=1234261 RepID=A0A813TAZ6_9BILA|nr:unnamed protein product [Didymodactylos carnosus]CAF1094042.1 unnamed protein product [Didymodactylos carnosus]CAF3591226.1 unnamed protein product [Didymodactylos carnosus]CAF3855529.1 unnamed protein product [Didymodactylos carnosus]